MITVVSATEIDLGFAVWGFLFLLLILAFTRFWFGPLLPNIERLGAETQRRTLGAPVQGIILFVPLGVMLAAGALVESERHSQVTLATKVLFLLGLVGLILSVVCDYAFMFRGKFNWFVPTKYRGRDS